MCVLYFSILYFVVHMLDLLNFHEISNSTRLLITISMLLKMFIKSLIILLLCSLPAVFCVRCYQCASSQDSKGDDSCGAYRKFDRESHIAVECGSDESHMPGSFCMKLTQQGPRGFIWDGRWRQVIRRCASVAETGVTGVCNWGVYENGVYWEECYCSADECNGSSITTSSLTVICTTIVAAFMSCRFM